MAQPQTATELLSAFYRPISGDAWTPDLSLTLDLRRQQELTDNYHRWLTGIVPQPSRSLNGCSTSE